MNSSPTILRFSSGSTTPRSRVRNRSLASTKTRLHAKCATEDIAHQISLAEAQQAVVDKDRGQAVADRAVDERRRHRRIDAAAETEQHPAIADRSWICRMAVSMKCSAVQFVRQSQTSTRKLRSRSRPSGVWATSGWNWMPKRRPITHRGNRSVRRAGDAT